MSIDPVRAVGPEQWEAVRDLRLAALSDTPSAFGSTYAREATFTRDDWMRRFSDRSATFVADLDGAPAGIAGGLIEDGSPDIELVSMWVAPRRRGRRIGTALVEAVAAWASDRDAPGVHLWVTESNEPAYRLYRRCGFVESGERQPLPSDPSLDEIGMTRPLR